MASCKNKCKTCDYCKKLYEMFGFRYWCSKKFYCAQQGKPISIDGGCENYKTRKTEYDLSLQRLDSVMDDITFMSERLKD